MTDKELAFEIFKIYFKREPGEGAWTPAQDAKQYGHILNLVEVWRPLPLDATDLLQYNDAMVAARKAGEYDRPYANEIRTAYNNVIRRDR